MLPIGDVSPLWAKRHTVSLPALIFFTDATKTNRSVVLKFGIIPSPFGLFYAFIEFLGI
jgi:hypothetical protein